MRRYGAQMQIDPTRTSNVTRRQEGRPRVRLTNAMIDLGASALFPFAAPFLYVASRRRWYLRGARALQDRLGVTVIQHHYYEPVAGPPLPDADGARRVPGIEWNLDAQREFLRQIACPNEVAALEGRSVGGRTFTYANPMFGAGDVEALYAMVRFLRPRTIVEVGAGVSTVIVRLALADLSAEQPGYAPRHVCFEPFENAWLESTGAEVKRQRIEEAGMEVFDLLGENDILFIDSSHVLRCGGDVEALFRHFLPRLRAGVYVHFHDVFTPRDYPARWLHADRRLWTEQYMLEAFLAFNEDFEVVLAVNDLHRRAEPEVRAAFPMLARAPHAEPGSFWIRRKAR